MKVIVKVTSKQELESIELIKDGSSTPLDINKNEDEYTSEKVITEEGTYQVKVRTGTEEETINIMIDLRGPQIEHSYNTETNTINMKVTDTGSGIKKIEVYSQTSTTDTGTITESKVEEFSYEDSPKEKELAKNVNNIPFGEYLRGYKITATDIEGNPTIVENTFNPPIQTYIIMNEEQLKQFANSITVANTYTGKTVYLGADIELNKGKYTLDEDGRIPTFASDAEVWSPIAWTWRWW